MKFLNALVVSLTFVVGFFLVEAIFLKKGKLRKINGLLIELAYFLIFWVFVYVYFI